ncbi:MAG: DNRLRE domain-containing protein, partial [Planctomycetes bacterium]|nr:DNRLRE domain-containing protein [Planctomycetota bacterium]
MADASADVLTLTPSKDNTVYEDTPGTNSNGAGIYLFSGTQASVGWARRALIQFDLSGIPAGSTINSASLQLRVSQTISGTQSMGAHLVTSDWGESTSDAPGQEGGGTPAATGDATWFSAFHPDTDWITDGGDFEASPSAVTGVSGSGSSPVWSSASMAADVQDWIDGAKPNFGWIIVHQNEAPLGTAKRFGSREGSSSSRPVLTIDFTPGAAQVGVPYCFGDGTSTPCPCGNAGSAGHGCANSSGSGGILEGSGSASVSADDLVLEGAQLIPSQPGLYFQGNNAVNSGNGNPFGDGLRCT